MIRPTSQDGTLPLNGLKYYGNLMVQSDYWNLRIIWISLKNRKLLQQEGLSRAIIRRMDQGGGMVFSITGGLVLAVRMGPVWPGRSAGNEQLSGILRVRWKVCLRKFPLDVGWPSVTSSISVQDSPCINQFWWYPLQWRNWSNSLNSPIRRCLIFLCLAEVSFYSFPTVNQNIRTVIESNYGLKESSQILNYPFTKAD